MKKNNRLEFDLGKSRKSEFEFKYLLIALFIAVVFLKTSGCTTTTAELNLDASTQNGNIETPNADDKKLLVRANGRNLDDAGQYLLVVSVEGGSKPFALFIGEKVPYSISFLDSRHAKILLNHKDMRKSEMTVYVLDGYGNTASVSAKLDF